MEVKFREVGCVLIRDKKRIRWERKLEREYRRMMIKIYLYPFWMARCKIKRLFYLEDQERYMTADELLKNKPEIYVGDLGRRFVIINRTLPKNDKKREFQALARKLSTQQVITIKEYAKACWRQSIPY